MDANALNAEDLIGKNPPRDENERRLCDQIQKLMMQNPEAEAFGLIWDQGDVLSMGLWPDEIWDEDNDTGEALRRIAMMLMMMKGVPRREGKFVGLLYTGVQARIMMNSPGYATIAKKLEAGIELGEEDYPYLEKVSIGMLMTPEKRLYEIQILENDGEYKLLPASVIDFEYGLRLTNHEMFDGKGGGPLAEHMHRIAVVVGEGQ